MCFLKKKNAGKDFKNKKIKDSALQMPKVNLEALYERAYDELSLQQSKRDQIITLYVGIISFLVPFMFSVEEMELIYKGWVFMVMSVVGALLAMIIIRYRIYKEAYWLCCQTITVLSGVDPQQLDKENVQAAYYGTMRKKVSSCMDGEGENAKLNRGRFIRKNIFSAESIYFFIHALITSLILGLGIAFVWPQKMPVAIAAAVVAFLLLCGKYFHECIKVYQVLIDKKDKSFNATFSKAWFLHFYLSDKKEGTEAPNGQDT